MPSKEYMRLYYLANREKMLQRAKDWALANPERTKQRVSAWHQENPDKVSAIKDRYREKNKDTLNAKHSARKKANPERGRIDAHNRRRAKVGKLSSGIINRLMELQGGKCPICKSSLKEVQPHLDHIMPIALGGLNVDNNVQLLCKPCNLHKSKKHPVDFMQSKGFLL